MNERATKAQAGLRKCADLPESSMLAYTKFRCRYILKPKWTSRASGYAIMFKLGFSAYLINTKILVQGPIKQATKRMATFTMKTRRHPRNVTCIILCRSLLWQRLNDCFEFRDNIVSCSFTCVRLCATLLCFTS